MFLLRLAFYFLLGFALGTILRTIAYAEEKAPKPFGDSSIKRVLKDGKVQKFDGNKFKIVPRIHQKKTFNKEVRKNRVNVLFGVGPSGELSSSKKGSVTEVSTDKEVIFGLQYQRKLDDKINVGIQIQTNETVLGSVGLDF